MSSWLDDITPDPGNPSTGMILGLLGGLGKAASPQFNGNMGISGQSKGNAILQLFGDLSGGVQGGMQGAQAYNTANLANQSAAIDLANKKQINPLMMQARLGALASMPGNTQNPTGLPSGQLPGSMAPQLSPYQQNASNMIDAAQRQFALTGDYKPLTDAWKSAFENDPSLAAEKAKQTDLNKIQTTPNGPMAGYQIPGMQGAPGGASSPGLFGPSAPMSLAPQLTSSVLRGIVGEREPGDIGPDNQTPAEIPTPEGQGQSLPSQAGYQGAAGAVPVQGPQQIPPINASALQPPPGGPQAMPQGQIPPPPSPQGMPPQQRQLPQGIPPAPGIQLPGSADPRQAAFQPPQQGALAQPNGQQQLAQLIAQQQGNTGESPQALAAAKSPQAALQNVAKGIDGKPLIAGDGQPVLPQLANQPFYKPDPTMTPQFNTTPTSNTNSGVDAVKTQIAQQSKDLSEGNQSFTEGAGSLTTEKYMLGQITQLLQQTQSGTAMAQWPEIARQAAALDIIKDPKSIKNLADLQTAIAISAKETLNNIKNNAAAIGGPSMRIFGSEVNAQIKNGINVENQPEALYNMVTGAAGLVNQHLDLINSWQKAGGAGNRLAGGNTMLPTDFTQQFLMAHPASAYQQAFAAQTPAFKGMSSTGSGNWVRINGRLVQQ